ncbi:MAG: hypothetical protein IJS04_06330, partial [Muribaculaceae bacterium]|nr:hypothetical protein [Muribaculaceae bacterium]
MNILKYCLSALAICSSMVAAAQGGVTEREAWFDFNFAARQAISASPATLDISSLPAGLHWFTMRVKDDQGVWSPAMTQAFVVPHEIDNSAPTQIQRVEVWFDNNFAERQAIGASVATVDISSLPAGLHSLTIRAQDDLGLWSSQKTVYFIISHEEVEEDVELVSYCYWFDDDVANLVVGTLPVSGKTVAGVIEIDMATVPSGQHTIHWMIGASNGAWAGYYGEVNSMSFYNSRGD